MGSVFVLRTEMPAPARKMPARRQVSDRRSRYRSAKYRPSRMSIKHRQVSGSYATPGNGAIQTSVCMSVVTAIWPLVLLKAHAIKCRLFAVEIQLSCPSQSFPRAMFDFSDRHVLLAIAASVGRIA
jgi:hypothetical protein